MREERHRGRGEFEELNVSGRKLHRRLFDRIIAQSTAPGRPVDVIVVYALSRFAGAPLRRSPSNTGCPKLGSG